MSPASYLAEFLSSLLYFIIKQLPLIFSPTSGNKLRVTDAVVLPGMQHGLSRGSVAMPGHCCTLSREAMLKTVTFACAVITAAAILDTPAWAQSSWCSVPVATAAASVGPIAQQMVPYLNSAPHPLAHVHTEGTLPHQGIRDASLQAEKDLPLMQNAALAWRAGAGEAYRSMAERYLDAWVNVYQPSFDPIDETKFDALIETYAIIQARMDASARAKAQHFLHAWANGYVAAINHAQAARKASLTWTNNWQSHRIKLVTLMATALEDSGLFAEARRLYWQQITANITPSGAVIDFYQRDALHYVVYDLEPLTRAALAAHVRGEDWYHGSPGSSKGVSLAHALDWLAPYASGQKKHMEFVHSHNAFDRKRAGAGVKGFSGYWDAKTAANLYWMASELDPSFRALAQSLSPQPPAFVALCGE